MKKLFVALLLLTSVSHADVIKCQFTEPWVTTVYNTTKSTLSYYDAGSKAKTVLKDVSFTILGAGTFQLKDKDNKVLQTVTVATNADASDGMSDTMYPYEVKDESLLIGHRNAIVGGCSSQFLKAIQQ